MVGLEHRWQGKRDTTNPYSKSVSQHDHRDSLRLDRQYSPCHDEMPLGARPLNGLWLIQRNDLNGE